MSSAYFMRTSVENMGLSSERRTGWRPGDRKARNPPAAAPTRVVGGPQPRASLRGSHGDEHGTDRLVLEASRRGMTRLLAGEADHEPDRHVNPRRRAARGNHAPVVDDPR